MADQTTSSSIIPVSVSSSSSTIPSPSLSQSSLLKLTPTNFLLRKTQLLPFLRSYGLEHHLDGSASPPSPIIDDKVNPQFQICCRNDQTVLSWIVSMLSEGVLHMVVNVKTAQEAWTKLTVTYGAGNRSQIQNLKTNLYRLSQRTGETVSQFFEHSKGYYNTLLSLGSSIPEDDLVEAILRGFNSSFRPFVRSIQSRHEEIGYDELFGLALTEELQLMEENSNSTINSPFAINSATLKRGRGRGGRRGGRLHEEAMVYQFQEAC